MNGKERSGWVVFAAIMMFGIGGIALLAAIADFVNPTWIEDQSILGNSLDFLWYGAFDLISLKFHAHPLSSPAKCIGPDQSCLISIA